MTWYQYCWWFRNPAPPPFFKGQAVSFRGSSQLFESNHWLGCRISPSQTHRISKPTKKWKSTSQNRRVSRTSTSGKLPWLKGTHPGGPDLFSTYMKTTHSLFCWESPICESCWTSPRSIRLLAGGWTNPSEKYGSNWITLPTRDENKKYPKPPPSLPVFSNTLDGKSLTSAGTSWTIHPLAASTSPKPFWCSRPLSMRRRKMPSSWCNNILATLRSPAES